MKRPTGTAASAPTTSAGATSATAAATNGSASSKSTDSLGRDPAVLQRRYAHRVRRDRRRRAAAGRQRATRRRTSTRTPDRSRRNSTCARAARSARFASAPRRRPTSTSPAASRRRSTRGSCRGGRASGSATTTRSRCPTGRAPTTWTSGLEWTNNKAMFRAAYNGSWFNNEADTLTWDNPLVLTDSTSRLRAWPDGPVAVQLAADAQRGWLREVRAADAAHRLARLRLGEQRRAAAAVHDQQSRCRSSRCRARRPTPSATTVATTIGLVSRPANVWRFSTRFRRYDYNNDMPETPIHDFINYDTSVKDSTTGGPELYAHARNTFDADATWTRFRQVALTVAYTNNHNGYDFASSSRRTRTCCSSRQTRPASGG